MKLEDRVVLFDMDGVLVDTRTSIELAWSNAALDFGRELSRWEIDTYVHGLPGARTMQSLFSDLSKDEQLRLKKNVDEIEERSPAPMTTGVFDLLERLRRSGHRLGLVTSSWNSRVDYVLRTNGLQDVFHTIVTRDDVSRGKPDPEPYLTAMSRMHAKRATAIEDSPAGVTSASTAGCHTIGFQPTGGSELARCGAHAVVRSFAEVEQVMAMGVLIGTVNSSRRENEVGDGDAQH
jgi:HAD superfamily hydrolase (TIGR01509 family)